MQNTPYISGWDANKHVTYKHGKRRLELNIAIITGRIFKGPMDLFVMVVFSPVPLFGRLDDYQFITHPLPIT